MIGKWKFHIRKLLISIGLMFAVFIVLQAVLFSTLNNISDHQITDVNENYFKIQKQFENLTRDNINLVKGLAAYIEINDIYDDDEMYTLLRILYHDKLSGEVRNVGVIEDTTVEWVYPIEGNEAVLNVDLSKVTGQADGVLKVKESMETGIFGPIDLVQGGQGIIIRIPILKSGNYWGMASIVLNADLAFQSINKLAVDSDNKLYISYKDDSDQKIFGDASILNEGAVKFSSSDKLTFWDIYMVPDSGWFNYLRYYAIFSIASLMISVFIGNQGFKWLHRYDTMAEDNAHMRVISTKDAFTGIYNRGYFDEHIAKEIEESDRYHFPLALIYFDIDHFKKINDDFGHSEGDLVLLEVTKVVKSITRSNDVFARWGGDEFILLLPHTDLFGTMAVAEKIRAGIERIRINGLDKITVSIGVAERVNLEFWESWFKRVDKALYYSKDNGKNRVTTTNQMPKQEIHTKIVWLEEWNCGMNTIDEAHRITTYKCNAVVRSSFYESQYDETVRLADELIREIREHFDDEIKFLEMIDYPDIEEHYALHENLYNKTLALYKKLIDREITSEELLHFLKDQVVLGHLVYADKKYRDFMQI